MCKLSVAHLLLAKYSAFPRLSSRSSTSYRGKQKAILEGEIFIEVTAQWFITISKVLILPRVRERASEWVSTVERAVQNKRTSEKCERASERASGRAIEEQVHTRMYKMEQYYATRVFKKTKKDKMVSLCNWHNRSNYVRLVATSAPPTLLDPDAFKR